MNKLTALLTITILLTSILAPATTLAYPTPKLEAIGTPQLSKAEVYIGPDHTITISVKDEDPVKVEVDLEWKPPRVTIYEELKELKPDKPDNVYALIRIKVGDKYKELGDLLISTDGGKVYTRVKTYALLELKETGNNTVVFEKTLKILPDTETKVVENVTHVVEIHVKPEDVAKGIVVEVAYPDLVAGELQWINKTFKIKAKVPSIEADEEEVAPGQNFTIILTAQSLNVDGEAPDYIAVSNKTGYVYWVTSEYKVKVGILNITVVDPEDNVVAYNLAKCVAKPVLVLTIDAEELRLYKETGANTAVFKIPVDGKCIRDAVAEKGKSLTEGYKINITYNDLYTDETVYVEIPVKKIMVSLKASMYYDKKKVVDLLRELPIIYYAKWKSLDEEPEKAGFKYTLNITVDDPAHLGDRITVEIYDVTNNKIEGKEFTVGLEGKGDVRYAEIDVNFTEKEIIFSYDGQETRVEIDKVYRYPVTGYVKIVYADKYTLRLSIALPKDDKIAITPTALDRVAGNVTLRFLFGDLPVVPEDLAIEVKWTSRDGKSYTYYFKAKDLNINATTGVAEINITKTLADKIGEFENEAAAARAIVGATVTFAYKDPATRFNAGREYTFETNVKVLAHNAKVELSSDVVGPFQWLNITITDPDIFYEAQSYIEERGLVILFNSTAKSISISKLREEKEKKDEVVVVFEQDGDKYKIAIKLWKITDYFDPAGDTILIYYYDDTPASKYVEVYRYQGKVSVKPTKGVIVEPKDGAVVSPGQQLIITVKDPDPKDGVSPEDEDTITVTVWSTSYPMRKSITLYETAADSGVFNTTILITDDWGARDEPGIVYAEPGDYIYIVYHDSYPETKHVVTLRVKEAAPAPALKRWIYINVSGVELAKDKGWWIERDPYTGVERLIVKLPFHNTTDIEFSTTYYSILYYREKPTAKYKFVDVGSDVPDLTVPAGAESVRLPIATVSKIRENALKHGGVEDGLYKIYASLIIINKATGDLATMVWKPQVGDWVVWPVILTIYVDSEGNIVKVVLGSV